MGDNMPGQPLGTGMLVNDSLQLHNVQDALTDPLDDTPAVPSEFSAILNARGLYSMTQFVMRLSPKIHELVQALAMAKPKGTTLMSSFRLIRPMYTRRSIGGSMLVRPPD